MLPFLSERAIEGICLVKMQEVANRLNAGKMWLPETDEWKLIKDFSEPQLRRIRKQTEHLYDAKPQKIPAHRRGGRLILRVLNMRIPPNSDPRKAVQIRTYCLFPTLVAPVWHDNDGCHCAQRFEATNPDEYKALIDGQMQRWSDVLFGWSKGKFALFWKTQPARQALTYLERNDGGRYYGPKKEFIKELYMDVRAHEPVLLALWVWTDRLPRSLTRDKLPPNFSVIKRGRCRGARYLVLFSTNGRMNDPLGWTPEPESLRDNLGGLPHEFWHVIQRLAKEVEFESCVLKLHRVKGKKARQSLVEEIEMLKAYCPRHVYEDRYSTILSWLTCKKLIKRLRWIDNWDQGPKRTINRQGPEA